MVTQLLPQLVPLNILRHLLPVDTQLLPQLPRPNIRLHLHLVVIQLLHPPALEESLVA